MEIFIVSTCEIDFAEKMRLIIIDCVVEGWEEGVIESLKKGLEIDLIHFDYTLHGEFCEAASASHSYTFKPDFINQCAFLKKSLS